VFAIIGLIGAFATVTLWFPLLDRMKPLRHGAGMLRDSERPWVFWSAPHLRLARGLALAVCAVVLAAGLARYHTDDDVHLAVRQGERLGRDRECARAQRSGGVT
jgi:predicted exporter